MIERLCFSVYILIHLYMLWLRLLSVLFHNRIPDSSLELDVDSRVISLQRDVINVLYEIYEKCLSSSISLYWWIEYGCDIWSSSVHLGPWKGSMCGDGRGTRQKETDIMVCQVSSWLLTPKLCICEREINSVLFKPFTLFCSFCNMQENPFLMTRLFYSKDLICNQRVVTL